MELATTYVKIQPVEPVEAAEVVDAVFEGMSAESRRLRFHVPMLRLPTSFRDQLARLDGRNHAAIAARIDGDVVGIGRLVGVSNTDCEMAMAVADEWQGRGIGRSILRELVDLAVGYRYERLIADVLIENSAMLALLCDRFPDAETTRSRGVAHIIARLDAFQQPPALAVPAQRSGACVG